MRVAIVGGGLLGLATALYLTRLDADPEIDVYESEDQPGGLSTYQDFGEFVWDRFYHCVLPSDLDLVEFIREVGLGERLRWNVTRTGFFDGGVLHSLSNTMEFLRFPVLGPVDKVRLGLTLAYGARIRDWRRLESLRAEEWLSRIAGRKVYEKIWRPLLRAKYGQAHGRVSAVAIWAAIARLYSARQPGLGREVLGYVEGGYRTLLEAVMGRLRAAKVKVHLGARVDRIEYAASGFRVIGSHGSEEVERVGVTVPATVAARLLPADAIDCGRLREVEYLGVVCWVLILDRRLGPFYVVNIADDSVPFTGVIEMSNLVGPEQTAGRHLVYVPRYVSATDPLYRTDAATVRATFLPGLRKIFPEFREEWVVREMVARAPRVQPLQTVGYSRLVEGARSNRRGLCVVNTSRLANATLNNNEVVRLAKELARDLARGEQ